MRVGKKKMVAIRVIMGMFLILGILKTGIHIEVIAAETQDPIVKILTFSDYQKWTSDWKDDWETLQTQLSGLVEGAEKAGADPDYMIFGGDYSCLNAAVSSETGKKQVDSIIRETWPQLEEDHMFVVQGNHDPEDTDGLMETGGYETEDFLVYILNEDIYPSKQGNDEAKDIVEKSAEELEEWLDLKIDEEETRPIFICSHTGLHYDIDRTDGNNQYAYKIFDVVNEAGKYLDLVFMFGHNHTNGDELVGGSITCIPKGGILDVCTENSIANRAGTSSVLNFTYMNYGYVGYIGDIYNNQSPYEVTDSLSISELWLYEDRIEVYRYGYNGVLEQHREKLRLDAEEGAGYGDLYTLSYESNGGTKIFSSQMTQSWSTVSRTSPAKADAMFLYWSTKADGTGNQYKPGESIYVTKDTVLYAQYMQKDAEGEGTVFEIAEKVEPGEVYMLAWNSELYTDQGTVLALTDGGTSNVTAMENTWIEDDGKEIWIPAETDTRYLRWMCGGSQGTYTLQNAATGKYLSYVNSSITYLSEASEDASFWDFVINSELTDSRAPEGTVLCNLVPNGDQTAFVRYSVGKAALQIGVKTKSTDTANSDVKIYKMISGSDSDRHVHSFGMYVPDHNEKCFTDGTQTRACACGVEETIPFIDSKTDHSYVYKNGRTDSNYHYCICEDCGKIEGKLHCGGTAETDALAKCEVCEKEYGSYAKWELPYLDVASNDWFAGAVSYAYKNGIMTGLDKTRFGPYEQLSRAQFALILYRMKGSPEVTSASTFEDVDGTEWYGKAVLWAAEHGIVGGYENQCFGPADNITREQMAVMMYRLAKYEKQDVNADQEYSSFTDAAKVSPFAEESIKWVIKQGILTGKAEGTMLDPQGETTRAEAVVMIYRFMERKTESDVDFI